MNKQQLVRLVIVAVVVICIGIVLNWVRYRAEEAARGTLGADVFPDFPLNDIHSIEMIGPDAAVTLATQDGIWQVRERYGYPADFEKLRELLISIKDLTVVQSVTAAPSQYGRLGLADLDDGESAGIRLAFRDGDGSDVGVLVLGNPYHRNDPQGMGWPIGRYIRVPRDTGDLVALVANPFRRVQVNPREWLDNSFIEVADVVAASLSDDDGVRWAIERDSVAADWRLKGFEPAPDQELKASTARSVADAFRYARFRDVADPRLSPAETGLDSPVVFTARTRDHVVYAIRIGEKTEDNHYYIAVHAAFEPPAAADAADNHGNADTEAPADEPPANRPQPGRAAAEEVNRKFGSWTYLVAAHTVDQVLREYDAFIETIEPLADDRDGTADDRD